MTLTPALILRCLIMVHIIKALLYYAFGVFLTSRLLYIPGVRPDQQMEIFRILAAVLHLGNVNVQASGRNSERSSIDVRNVFSYLSEVPVMFFFLLAISIPMSVSS